MNKFKIGDRVKRVSGANNRIYGMLVGKEYTVTDCPYNSVISVDGRDESWNALHFELVSDTPSKDSLQGKVVELRDGDKALVLSCGLVFDNLLRLGLGRYEQNLTHTWNTNYDIMKVYSIKDIYALNFDRMVLELEWEREESKPVVELTLAEIAAKMNVPVEQLRIKE